MSTGRGDLQYTLARLLSNDVGEIGMVVVPRSDASGLRTGKLAIAEPMDQLADIARRAKRETSYESRLVDVRGRQHKRDPSRKRRAPRIALLAPIERCQEPHSTFLLRSLFSLPSRSFRAERVRDLVFIGELGLDPVLVTSAGPRLTVYRRAGISMPAFVSAAVTRRGSPSPNLQPSDDAPGYGLNGLPVEANSRAGNACCAEGVPRHQNHTEGIVC